MEPVQLVCRDDSSFKSNAGTRAPQPAPGGPEQTSFWLRVRGECLLVGVEKEALSLALCPAQPHFHVCKLLAECGSRRSRRRGGGPREGHDAAFQERRTSGPVLGRRAALCRLPGGC